MNAKTPFNPAAHDFFVAAGYVLETEEGRQEEAPSLAVLS